MITIWRGVMKDFDDNKFYELDINGFTVEIILGINEFIPLIKFRKTLTLEDLGYSFEVGV